MLKEKASKNTASLCAVVCGVRHHGGSMGLDAVELLIAIEDEFEIGIADEDACNLTTPYILSKYIYSRVRNIENT